MKYVVVVFDVFEHHGFKNPRLFALSGIASFRRTHLQKQG